MAGLWTCPGCGREVYRQMPRDLYAAIAAHEKTCKAAAAP